MDVLADVLDALSVRSSLYCRAEVGAPWALDFDPAPCCIFHIVEAGACCFLPPEGSPPVPLQTGDVLLLPQGAGHRIASSDGAELCFRIGWESLQPEIQHLCYHTEGALTTLVCGKMDFEVQNRHPLIDTLPTFIHVPGEPGSDLAYSIEFLYREAQPNRTGANTVIKRLSDILFIQIIREWAARLEYASTGFVAALQDAETARALQLLHTQPERNWTVASLASAVALSRSAFAERFTTLVGEPPLSYLTRWRMHRAARRLRETSTTVQALARDSGYRSEGAFSHAFKRLYGVRPGEYRRQAQ